MSAGWKMAFLCLPAKRNGEKCVGTTQLSHHLRTYPSLSFRTHQGILPPVSEGVVRAALRFKGWSFLPRNTGTCYDRSFIPSNEQCFNHFKWCWIERQEKNCLWHPIICCWCQSLTFTLENGTLQTDPGDGPWVPQPKYQQLVISLADWILAQKQKLIEILFFFRLFPFLVWPNKLSAHAQGDTMPFQWGEGCLLCHLYNLFKIVVLMFFWPGEPPLNVPQESSRFYFTKTKTLKPRGPCLKTKAPKSDAVWQPTKMSQIQNFVLGSNNSKP